MEHTLEFIINLTREKMGIDSEKKDVNYFSRLGTKSGENDKTSRKPMPTPIYAYMPILTGI